ncbi:hypothetical protein P7C73_g1160, partial [Tremellales sp. Uapishka_1]
MAYGAIAPPSVLATLPILSFEIPDGSTVTTYPVHGREAPQEVLEYLHGVFSVELASGTSYPQEGPMSLEAFIAYFFSSTTIVAIAGPAANSLEEACRGKSAVESVTGCYYISHNGGFIVPPSQRGRKIGVVLGKSFLQYAPKLGYRASVFNLVYKSRLKTGPGGEEEYVDAFVVYKSFV